MTKVASTPCRVEVSHASTKADETLQTSADPWSTVENRIWIPYLLQFLIPNKHWQSYMYTVERKMWTWIFFTYLTLAIYTPSCLRWFPKPLFYNIECQPAYMPKDLTNHETPSMCFKLFQPKLIPNFPEKLPHLNRSWVEGLKGVVIGGVPCAHKWRGHLHDIVSWDAPCTSGK